MTRRDLDGARAEGPPPITNLPPISRSSIIESLRPSSFSCERWSMPTCSRWIERCLVAVALAVAVPNAALAQHLLVPMDDGQSNQLKAYGLAFNALRDGNKAEWFINYRSGARPRSPLAE